MVGGQYIMWVEESPVCGLNKVYSIDDGQYIV